MAEVSGSVWPSVELTDSEDEEHATKGPRRKNPLADCAPDVTQEEINGDFPLFNKHKDDASSESDEEEDEKVVEKKNPYLMHQTSSKFNDKLRALQMKRNEARFDFHRDLPHTLSFVFLFCFFNRTISLYILRKILNRLLCKDKKLQQLNCI